jgi:hypothetical protein
MEKDVLHAGEIQAQERFGVSVQGRKMSAAIRDHLSQAVMDFIEAQPFFFLATSNRDGDCDCSFRGSEPGDGPAIKALSDTSLVFPDYAGNNLFNSLGNILVNPHVGILFVDFGSASRFRVNGGASVIEDAALYHSIWPNARRYVRVEVHQAFANCRKRVPHLAA